jgi:hypothetical protein
MEAERLDRRSIAEPLNDIDTRVANRLEGGDFTDEGRHGRPAWDLRWVPRLSPGREP